MGFATNIVIGCASFMLGMVFVSQVVSRALDLDMLVGGRGCELLAYRMLAAVSWRHEDSTSYFYRSLPKPT